jgi:predicted transcriptional regulator
MKLGEYRKPFDIPTKHLLTANGFSDARRKMAKEKGLGNILAYT